MSLLKRAVKLGTYHVHGFLPNDYRLILPKKTSLATAKSEFRAWLSGRCLDNCGFSLLNRNIEFINPLLNMFSFGEVDH